MNEGSGYMNHKYQVLKKIKDNQLIFIIRDDHLENIEKIMEAGIAGGLRSIELTMTTPGVLRILERLRSKFQHVENLVIGVGTVMDAVTARMAITSGADFIVSPHLDEEIITTCHRYNMPVIPGGMTVTEINRAIESGAEVIKLFPSNILGPNFIKDIKGPIPNANFIPTGGINIENMCDWLNGGAFAVGIGSAIYKKGVLENDFEFIEKKAREYVDKIENHEVKNL